ncbi:MAG: hypothetical protein ACOWWM_18440 [Desulfobacterales bacterium]
MSDYALTHEQLCNINIWAGKVRSVGDLLMNWKPGEFPNSEEVFIDLGMGLTQTARKISGTMDQLDAAAVKGTD